MAKNAKSVTTNNTINMEGNAMANNNNSSAIVNNNNSKEESTMTNVNNSVLASALVSSKRVQYSDALVRGIKADILAGLSFPEISIKRGVKSMETIKRWLGIYYPVKKNVAKTLYSKLKANNRHAKHVEKLVSDNNFISDYADWYGSDVPEVDVIIDGRFTEKLMERAKFYCNTNGLSYVISSPEIYVNLQALVLGKPMVISFSDPLKDDCEEDGIKFMPHTELPEIPNVTVEENDIEFSKGYRFECMKLGKNGVLSCYRFELANEFRKQHSLSLNCQLTILVDTTLAPERLGLRNGQNLIFLLKEGNDLTSWKYELKDGVFHEIGYASGRAASLLKFIKRA